jgi:hypothetical protein
VTDYRIDENGHSWWTDENGDECYSTFNLADPERKHTFQAFLGHLIWRDTTCDEGFPGPARYTKRELINLAQDAVELLSDDQDDDGGAA